MGIRVFGYNLFWVNSTCSSKEYLVDMDDADFPDGHCDCAHFRYKLARLIGSGLDPSEYICKHIQEVLKSDYYASSKTLKSGEGSHQDACDGNRGV